MLLAGDGFGILSHINLFNVRTRGDNKVLDNLEEKVTQALQGKASAEEPTDLPVEDIRVLSEAQFESFTDGISIPRGHRKRLEYLLVEIATT